VLQVLVVVVTAELEFKSSLQERVMMLVLQVLVDLHQHNGLGVVVQVLMEIILLEEVEVLAVHMQVEEIAQYLLHQPNLEK